VPYVRDDGSSRRVSGGDQVRSGAGKIGAAVEPGRTYRPGLARLRPSDPLAYLEIRAFVGELGETWTRQRLRNLRRRYRPMLERIAADEPEVRQTLELAIQSARHRCA